MFEFVPAASYIGAGGRHCAGCHSLRRKNAWRKSKPNVVDDDDHDENLM